MKKKKDGILKSVPLRMRILIGLIALSGGIAVIQKPLSFKEDAFWSSLLPMIEAGLWISIFLALITLLAFIVAALVVSAAGKSKKKVESTDKKSDDHHPTPAAAPAGAGHVSGDHGHAAGHGHSESLATKLIAVMLVAFPLGLILFGVKSCNDSQQRATVVIQTPSATTTVLSQPTVASAEQVVVAPSFKASACPAVRPPQAQIFEAPTEGCSEVYRVPQGSYPCTDPSMQTGLLRKKAWHGDASDEPNIAWGSRGGEFQCFGAAPKADGTPAAGSQTGYIWFEEYEWQ